MLSCRSVPTAAWQPEARSVRSSAQNRRLASCPKYYGPDAVFLHYFSQGHCAGALPARPPDCGTSLQKVGLYFWLWLQPILMAKWRENRLWHSCLFHKGLVCQRGRRDARCILSRANEPQDLQRVSRTYAGTHSACWATWAPISPTIPFFLPRLCVWARPSWKR